MGAKMQHLYCVISCSGLNIDMTVETVQASRCYMASCVEPDKNMTEETVIIQM